MTTKQITDSMRYLRQQIRKFSTHPGQIIMRSNALTDGLVKEVSLSQREANFIANLILFNKLIDFDGVFIKLTENGYSYLTEDNSDYLRINISSCLPISSQRQLEQFYIIWDIIGLNKNENPYYVDGKMFYDEIKRYVNGLPPTYSQYTRHLQESGLSTSRNEWCKNLYLQLSSNEIEPFLSSLSESINQKLTNIIHDNTISLEFSDGKNRDLDIQHIVAVQTDLNMERKDKSPKIFISHNSEDKEYARALVRLLRDLGVDDERDIFCSSVPGCGVEFGRSFIETIRSQYDDHNLIMLYIHSPRYYESHVSLCEMGASWIMQHEHRSFLTHDCEFSMLDAVIPPTEIAFKAGKEDTYHVLNDFKEFIERTFGLHPKAMTRWEEYKNAFISSVSAKS